MWKLPSAIHFFVKQGAFVVPKNPGLFHCSLTPCFRITGNGHCILRRRYPGTARILPVAAAQERLSYCSSIHVVCYLTGAWTWVPESVIGGTRAAASLILSQTTIAPHISACLNAHLLSRPKILYLSQSPLYPARPNQAHIRTVCTRSR